MTDKIILAGKQHVLEPLIPLIITTNLLLTELRLVQESRLKTGSRKGHPIVNFYFSTTTEQHKQGIKYLSGEFSFRLMNYTKNSILPSHALPFAQKIAAKFAKPPFVWRKGKVMATYNNWDKGIALQILCLNSSEGRRVIDSILEVAGIGFEGECLQFNNNSAPDIAYPVNPGNEIVFGESVEEENRRREVDVTFRYATLGLGKSKVVPLVDLTGKHGIPLVDV